MSPTAPGGQSLTSWGQDSHPHPLQPPGVRASPHRCGAHTHIPYSPRGQGPHPTGAGLTDTSWENMPDKEKRSPHPGSRTVAHREGPKDAEQPLGKHYSNCLGENDTEK